MRLHEFSNSYENKVIEAIKQVKIDASDFLKSHLATGEYLLRGIHDVELPAVFTEDSPINREPQGQSGVAQQTLDYILRKCGFTSLRHNSICCASDFYGARRFTDNIYYVFPHNGYSFTWSEKINDIGGTHQLSIELRRLADERMDGYHNGILPLETCQKFINDYKFRHDDMTMALTSGNEVTIHGKYTLIKYAYEELIEKLLLFPE